MRFTKDNDKKSSDVATTYASSFFEAKMEYYALLPSIILFFLIAILCIYLSYNALPLGSDNGNILIESQIYLEDGFNRAFERLQPFIPTILNAIFLSISPRFPLILIEGIFSILLCLLTFRIIYVEFDRKTATISLIMILFSPIFFERSWNLAPYTIALFLIVSSILFFQKSIKNNQNNIAFTVASAFFMAMAVYTWTLALPILALPILYYLVNKNHRDNMKILLTMYAAMFILLLPWLIWHLYVADIKNFMYHNYTWYSIKYLPIVNREFWGYGSPGYSDIAALFKYYGNFFSLFLKQLLIPSIWLFVVVALIINKSSFKWLLLFWILVITLPLLFIQAAAFSRYIYFTLPPFIILAAYGVRYILARLKYKLALVVISIITVIGVLQIPTYISNFKSSPSYPSAGSPSLKDINSFKVIIDDNKRIFARSYEFQYLIDNRFICATDLGEEDAISFLSWNNEATILEIMEKHQIGWIMLNKDKRWEEDYYVWVNELTGSPSRHYIKISDSPNFEKMAEGKIYILYKLRK